MTLFTALVFWLASVAILVVLTVRIAAAVADVRGAILALTIAMKWRAK